MRGSADKPDKWSHLRNHKMGTKMDRDLILVTQLIIIQRLESRLEDLVKCLKIEVTSLWITKLFKRASSREILRINIE